MALDAPYTIHITRKCPVRFLFLFVFAYSWVIFFVGLLVRSHFFAFVFSMFLSAFFCPCSSTSLILFAFVVFVLINLVSCH
jgi:hypothetical protein